MGTRPTPATGVCQWLAPAVNGNPRLEIQVMTSEGVVAHIYEVVRSESGGFRLLRGDVASGDVIVYNVRCVRRGVWSCDCPDATNRRACACKHARALPKALQSLPF